MEKNAKIYVAGHKGLVGSAICRYLHKEGYENIVTVTKEELDLMNYEAVKSFFSKETPHYVIIAAARVGGIFANNLYKAEFIYENLQIQNNLIHNAYLHGVTKLLFLGSSCIYPKFATQPIKEEYLLTGALEPTNDAYAVAKIAGIMMCKSYNLQYGTRYISAMPTNLYGYNDNFDLTNSHVLPAFIRKFHEAKVQKLDKVIVGGSGTPRREFLFVEDLAEALVFLMNHYDDNEIVNVGTGEDITISGLADLIKGIIGYKGSIELDPTKPDGTPRKLLDVTKITQLGWRAKTPLSDGINLTYDWYCRNLI